jgi:hypothetical protein
LWSVRRVMSVMAVHPIRNFDKSAPQLPSTKNSIFLRHGVPFFKKITIFDLKFVSKVPKGTA